MCTALTQDTLFLEATKWRDRYLLIYPNTPSGRVEADIAVHMWLNDRELDFNRQDAERLWKAIDQGRLNGLSICLTIGRSFDGDGGLQ